MAEGSACVKIILIRFEADNGPQSLSNKNFAKKTDNFYLPNVLIRYIKNRLNQIIGKEANPKT